MADAICKPTHKRFKDIEGQTFSRLLVLSFAGLDKYHQAVWNCRCECGTEKPVNGSYLRRSIRPTKSCGCLSKETSAATGRAHAKHGMWKTAEYQAWADMLQRCENKKHKSYHRYGGRGITVCERWHSFVEFIADMGKIPSPGLTLERLDNSKGYDPQNCEWRSWTCQSRNRQSNRFFDYKGQRLCLADVAKEIGLNPMTLSCRLNRGWSFERATTQALRNQVRINP